MASKKSGGAVATKKKPTASMKSAAKRTVKPAVAKKAPPKAVAPASKLTKPPAKKALTQTRKLGSAGVARAVHILAEADLDLRGRRDLPGAVVVELAVARLTRLGAARR